VLRRVLEPGRTEGPEVIPSGPSVRVERFVTIKLGFNTVWSWQCRLRRLATGGGGACGYGRFVGVGLPSKAVVCHRPGRCLWLGTVRCLAAPRERRWCL